MTINTPNIMVESRGGKTGCDPPGQPVYLPKNDGLGWDFGPAARQSPPSRQSRCSSKTHSFIVNSSNYNS